jgi:putative tryptophan/tyrosine transport system substrate-binding protein
MKRRDFVALLGATMVAGVPPAAKSQPRRRIGFLHASPEGVANLRLAAYREGLRAADGRDASDVEVIARFAGGKVPLLPALARDLIAVEIAALLAVSPPGVRAASQATKAVPIVAVDLESDPVASGWAESLARPGRNVSGVFLDLPEFSGKCLQILRDAVPGLVNVGILWDPAVGFCSTRSGGEGRGQSRHDAYCVQGWGTRRFRWRNPQHGSAAGTRRADVVLPSLLG